MTLPASLSAPEAQIVSDGLSLASAGLTAAKLGLATFFSAAETTVPKLSADAIPAVTSIITNLCPPAAQPFLAMILGVADEAASAALAPLDSKIVSELALAASNVDAALSHLGTLI